MSRCFIVATLSCNPDLLVRFCTSVRESGFQGQILVAADGLPADLDLSAFGNVRRVECPKPFCFARNVNILLHAAGTQDVFLANDDVLVRGRLDLLSETAKASGVGLVSASIPGNLLLSPGAVVLRVRDAGHHTIPFAAVYLSRRTVDHVGLLDEQFVGYGYEDDDYSTRTRLAGLRNLIDEHCIVEHEHPSATFSRREDFIELRKQNERIYNQKWPGEVGKVERVMMATINADHPQTGMIAAFEEHFGSQFVRHFDYLERKRRGDAIPTINHDFVEECKRFDPQWIWLQLQETNVISPRALVDLRKALPHVVVSHWMGDCRRSVGSYLMMVCHATNLTLVSNTGQLAMYRRAGAKRTEYCQIGVDWDEDVLGIPDWTPPFRIPDVVFCGNWYGGHFPGSVEREATIRALMKEKIDVGVVGSGWPDWAPVVGTCGVKQQHHVYKRAKVALSVSNFNDIARYYSDRQLISMASGTPVVCKYVPELEMEFRDGEHCLFFRTADEAVAQVKRLLGDASLRRDVGARGAQEIVANHTWKARIRTTLPIIEQMRAELRRSV